LDKFKTPPLSETCEPVQAKLSAKVIVLDADVSPKDTLQGNVYPPEVIVLVPLPAVLAPKPNASIGNEARLVESTVKLPHTLIV
jgi:hypothetical protein